MPDTQLTQDEINRREWEDPDNWSGPRWLSVYFNRKDTRTWVPKQIPLLGWTINLGKTAGVYWLLGAVIGVPLFVIAVAIIAIAVAAAQ